MFHCLLLYILQAFEELERLLSARGICVAVKEKLTKDSGVAGSFDFNHIVKKLLAKPKARGKKYVDLLFIDGSPKCVFPAK